MLALSSFRRRSIAAFGLKRSAMPPTVPSTIMPTTTVPSTTAGAATTTVFATAATTATTPSNPTHTATTTTAAAAAAAAGSPRGGRRKDGIQRGYYVPQHQTQAAQFLAVAVGCVAAVEGDDIHVHLLHFLFFHLQLIQPGAHLSPIRWGLHV